MSFNGIGADPWHDITLESPYTAGSPAPQYRIDDAGNAHLRGQVVRNAAASGDVAFTLPEMYWPTALARLRIVSAPGGTLARVNVGTAGAVALLADSGAVTDYFIDCTFSTY